MVVQVWSVECFEGLGGAEESPAGAILEGKVRYFLSFLTFH